MFEKLTDSEIRKIYKDIEKIWETDLKQHSVKLPGLSRNGKFTKNALVLIYLYNKQSKVVTKNELTQFLNYKGQPSDDVQQARHLARQQGWNILSGTRPDVMPDDTILNSGEYTIIDLTKPYDSFSFQARQTSLSNSTFEKIKNSYNYRCATCGSKEGEPEYTNPSRITTLQKGHMNPNNALDESNTIPQCDSCNRIAGDKFIFDKQGRVSSINKPDFFLRSPKKTIDKVLKIFVKNYENEVIELLEKAGFHVESK